MRTQTELFYADPDYLAEGILHADFIWDAGTEELNGAYALANWRDDFYRWDAGRYVRVSESEIKRLIVRHLHQLNQMDRYSFGNSDQHIRITTQLINNILLCIAGTEGVHIPEDRELNTWDDPHFCLSTERRGGGIQTLSVDNGLLMLDNKSTEPLMISHTPRYFSLTKLPYDYQPQADCPMWQRFLDEVMLGNAEYIQLLQQWAGYLFRADLREQKFLLCSGVGSNGKGVFFDCIQALVGRENCSQVPLARFSKPFALYATLGKVVNATNESSHIIEAEAESILKSFVAGDMFTFERKFREPMYAQPTAKIMIATNNPPKFNDRTEGLWRRLLLVPFEQVFSEDAQIKDLAERLKKELPGILNWALKGLARLNENGSLLVPKAGRSLVEQYRRESNPARQFLQENFVECLDFAGLPCSEVYNSYVRWCQDNGYKSMNSSNFGKEVQRTMPKVKKERIRKDGRQVYAYSGLATEENSEIICPNFR